MGKGCGTRYIDEVPMNQMYQNWHRSKPRSLLCPSMPHYMVLPVIEHVQSFPDKPESPCNSMGEIYKSTGDGDSYFHD